MDFSAVSWLGVIIGSIAFFAIGGIWYGPLFSKKWLELTDQTEEDLAGSNMPLTYGGTFVLTAIAAVALGALIGADASPGSGAAVGFVVGLLIVSTTLAVNMLYERKPPALLGLNAGYNILGFTAMGAILGALQ